MYEEVTSSMKERPSAMIGAICMRRGREGSEWYLACHLLYNNVVFPTGRADPIDTLIPRQALHPGTQRQD